ncbi:MAG: hypothetical protein EWV76_21735 [Microcystis novacekii Mn_MB_F_20050700_S1]|uniref:Uncharacterized protein n=1 Tax=Microcystis novacekii Mn_MB_F_20050700_S1D TaxID=2486266 RepID=A0A552IVK5_9CHRO|nr:MAG: hypothetical protein EWV76_21735 [Microcystis novacekii Mn_MB_F_20050700_S1]TRU87502.1 MAG: hypothetical protein EWV54_12375 [Microcystis novacekii Mn_MB_F_20050700_S1D]
MDAISIIAIGDDHIVSKAVKPSCFWGCKLFISLLSLSETAIAQHLMKWLFRRFDLKIDFLIENNSLIAV